MEVGCSLYQYQVVHPLDSNDKRRLRAQPETDWAPRSDEVGQWSEIIKGTAKEVKGATREVLLPLVKGVN